MIPESVVITEKADDATAQAFCDHLERHAGQGQRLQRRWGRHPDRDGFELTQRRIQFAARWFGPSICVSGAGQPADELERRTIVDHLRRLGDTAAETRNDARARNAQGSDPERAGDARRLMDEIAHPHVRLNFDTGNIAYYNDAAQTLAMSLNR